MVAAVSIGAAVGLTAAFAVAETGNSSSTSPDSSTNTATAEGSQAGPTGADAGDGTTAADPWSAQPPDAPGGFGGSPGAGTTSHGS